MDRSSADEWTDGHRPQDVEVGHDALYRVTSADYTYHVGNGRVSPSDSGTDWRVEQARTRAVDPMGTTPAPMFPSVPTSRVSSLTWSFDWLGNSTEWTDDAHAFYERSIGSIRNGLDSNPSGGGSDRPSALYRAADLDGPASTDRGGYLDLVYGEDGNVLELTAHAQCADIGLTRCTSASTCQCAIEQRYLYRWDELNRLSEARRYDNGTFVVRQRYRYDGANVRTVKQTIDPVTGDSRVALYVHGGDFERRGLRLGEDTYEADAQTETQYLVAGARIVWEAPPTGDALDADARITVPIANLIGTTSAVLDLRSGELVEEGTYYPNGARETLRTSETPVPAEPMGFTGKEADEEVGVTVLPQLEPDFLTAG